jgi:V-type H+-transporting ATPase subunit A
LNDKIHLEGKDALPELDKLTVDVFTFLCFIIFQLAQILREDFLQQNIFSSYDRNCPFYKAYWMLKTLVGFYEKAKLALEMDFESDENEKLDMKKLRKKLEDIWAKLSMLKFRV